MARGLYIPSEISAKGAVVRVVVALCLACPAPVAFGYEKSEDASSSDASGLALSASGLAGLASLESAVQEMASMKWSNGSNVAVSTSEGASATDAKSAAEKKDSGTAIDSSGPKNSFLPPGALEAARLASSSSESSSSPVVAPKESASPVIPSSSGFSSSSSGSSSGSKGLSLNMPASEADRLKALSGRINASMGTMGGTVKDAQDRAKNALNPTGKDTKSNDGGTPIDRDAASKAKFGAKGDLSLNNIADNRAKEDDPFEEFLKDQKKKQASKDKEKSKEEKEKEEKERKELEEKMTELANKPPPFTLQDYYDFRDLIAKKNKALGDAADNQPEFAKKAQTIFDEFQSRDGDEAKKQAFRDFVENSRDRELFQNPIIVDPILDAHRAGVSH